MPTRRSHALGATHFTPEIESWSTWLWNGSRTLSPLWEIGMHNGLYGLTYVACIGTKMNKKPFRCKNATLLHTQTACAGLSLRHCDADVRVSILADGLECNLRKG